MARNDFERAANQMEETRENLRNDLPRGLRMAMSFVETAVDRELRSNDSLATKALYNAINRENAVGGASPIAGAMLLERIAVTAPERAKYTEYGTGPRGSGGDTPLKGIPRDYPAPSSLPPYERIVRWIAAKGVTPREYKTQYGLAIALQHSIEESGTAAHPFMRPAWYGSRGDIQRTMQRSFERAVAKAWRGFSGGGY